MANKEALNTICLECQKYKGKIQVACPFRSISGDYCEEYEQIEKALEALEIIKKRQIDIQDIIDTSDDYDLYVAYCKGRYYDKDFICNEYEFRLLKEVLADDE